MLLPLPNSNQLDPLLQERSQFTMVPGEFPLIVKFTASPSQTFVEDTLIVPAVGLSINGIVIGCNTVLLQ